jgi:beta-phosphoglucomutase
MSPRGVVFDFNGTLSDDEPILCAVYRELFSELGRPLAEAEYYEQLAGHTDEEIFARWLGRRDPALVGERIARYRARAGDGSTVDQETRAAVRFAAARGPVAIVSAAVRSEIEQVVAAAGLADVFATIVSEDDVERGKPDPEPYLRAAALLDVPPAELLAFEDSEPGVASAKAAGLRVVALTRTLGPERLALADELAPRIDVALVRRLLG